MKKAFETMMSAIRNDDPAKLRVAMQYCSKEEISRGFDFAAQMESVSCVSFLASSPERLIFDDWKAFKSAAQSGAPKSIEIFLQNKPSKEILGIALIKVSMGTMDSEKTIQIVKMLLDAGADPDFNDGGPLFSTLARKNMDMLRCLAELDNVDLNRPINGFTPLMTAVAAHSLPMAEILLQNGANPAYRNENGIMAEDIGGLENCDVKSYIRSCRENAELKGESNGGESKRKARI